MYTEDQRIILFLLILLRELWAMYFTIICQTENNSYKFNISRILIHSWIFPFESQFDFLYLCFRGDPG